jgi:uncharacterized protein (TIGR00288 family)
MADESSEKLVAVFIDAENLIRPLEQRFERFNLDGILRRVKGYGVLILSRSYADWGFYPCKEYIRDFSYSGVEMSQVHSDIRGKNTADMQLAVDVMEHCQTKHAAEIIVLASGDRDFVPLVQSLRRQGKEVICIGYDDSSNQTLQQICDVYISYGALASGAQIPAKEMVPATQALGSPAEPAAPTVDPLQQAFQTLVDSILAIKRSNKPQNGGNANQVMRQMMPSFDFLALGFDSFKAFVEDAHKKGLVKMTPPASGLGDFWLDVITPETVAAPPEPVSVLNYDSVDEAVETYKRLLAEKRVPLISWKFRKPLVEHMWEFLQTRGEVGAMGSELVRELMGYSYEQEWSISEEQIFKLIYTLNLGFCFKISGVAQKTTDIMNNFLTPSVDLEQAFEFMHYVYMSGLKHADWKIIWKPEAVAELFFNSRSQAALKISQKLIYGLLEWSRFR